MISSHSLKSKIMGSFAISFFIFLLFVSVIIFLCFNIAIQGWYKTSENRYVSSVIIALDILFFDNKTPTRQDIESTVKPLLKDRFSLLIVTPQGEPIINHALSPDMEREAQWIINKTKENPIDETLRCVTQIVKRETHREVKGNHRNETSRCGMQTVKQQRPHSPRSHLPHELRGFITPIVTEDGQIALFVAANALRFGISEKSNRKLFKYPLIILFAGLIISISVAILFTFIISDKIAKDAKNVSQGLKKMATGSRNVSFGESYSNEISSIRKSALILQEKLLKEETATKQWTQDIAHDLRTPITALKAQLEAMIDGVLKPDKQHMEKLLSEINRLESLTEDVNRLTKIESQETKPNISEISSGEIADMIKERFSIAAEEKGIQLEIKQDDFLLNCDTNYIIRAISNLVQNSITHSFASSTENKVLVFLKQSKDSTSAEIGTENNGHIPDDELDKIFDRLYRGEFARSSVGSGLGLTIAKAAIVKQGGTIKAENISATDGSIGKVRFTIKLPLNNYSLSNSSSSLDTVSQ